MGLNSKGNLKFRRSTRLAALAVIVGSGLLLSFQNCANSDFNGAAGDGSSVVDKAGSADTIYLTEGQTRPAHQELGEASKQDRTVSWVIAGASQDIKVTSGSYVIPAGTTAFDLPIEALVRAGVQGTRYYELVFTDVATMQVISSWGKHIVITDAAGDTTNTSTTQNGFPNGIPYIYVTNENCDNLDRCEQVFHLSVAAKVAIQFDWITNDVAFKQPVGYISTNFRDYYLRPQSGTVVIQPGETKKSIFINVNKNWADLPHVPGQVNPLKNALTIPIQQSNCSPVFCTDLKFEARY